MHVHQKEKPYRLRVSARFLYPDSGDKLLPYGKNAQRIKGLSCMPFPKLNLYDSPNRFLSPSGTIPNRDSDIMPGHSLSQPDIYQTIHSVSSRKLLRLRPMSEF